MENVTKKKLEKGWKRIREIGWKTQIRATSKKKPKKWKNGQNPEKIELFLSVTWIERKISWTYLVKTSAYSKNSFGQQFLFFISPFRPEQPPTMFQYQIDWVASFCVCFISLKLCVRFYFYFFLHIQMVTWRMSHVTMYGTSFHSERNLFERPHGCVQASCILGMRDNAFDNNNNNYTQQTYSHCDFLCKWNILYWTEGDFKVNLAIT